MYWHNIDGASFLTVSVKMWLNLIKLKAKSRSESVLNVVIWLLVFKFSFDKIDLIRTIVYRIYGPVFPSNEANLSISKM